MSNLVLELVPEFSLLHILKKAPAGFDCDPVPFLPKYNVVFGSLIAVLEVCVGCKTINELFTKLPSVLPKGVIPVLPPICNFPSGLVVPIPTLPAESNTIFVSIAVAAFPSAVLVLNANPPG